MRKHFNLASPLILLVIMTSTSTLIPARVHADTLDPLVLTEIDPFTLIASIGGLSSAGNPILNNPGGTFLTLPDGRTVLVFNTGPDAWTVRLPLDTINEDRWAQTWEHSTGPSDTKYVNATAYRQLPTDYSYLWISEGPLPPPPRTLVSFTFIGSTLPVGAIASFPDNPFFSGVRFVDLTATGTVPDHTSTCLLGIIAGIGLYGSRRLGIVWLAPSR